MRIKLLVIGKIKDQYLKNGIDEYILKLSNYTKVEIIEVKDESLPDNPNESEIKKVINIEGDRILKLLKENDYLIGLDLGCKEMDSEEFASYLEKAFVKANSTINFVIGGSYGLSDSLKKRCNDRLSLSKMTFLHQMTRLILLEQIYRAFKINRNETYHK